MAAVTGLAAGAAVFLAVVLVGLDAGPGSGRRLRALRTMPPARAARSRPAVEPPAPPGRWTGRRGRTPGLDAATVAVLARRVAGLSRAGLALPRVWPVLAEHDRIAPGLCARVATTVAMGGTTAEGLRLAAPGAGPVAWLALACAVAERAGAPMAEVLDGVAAVIRADEEAERQRNSALAGPRATAALLSWLPLAGVGLGLLTGVDAIGVLVTTAPGRGCLAAGLTLWGGGWWWMRRLLRAAPSR